MSTSTLVLMVHPDDLFAITAMPVESTDDLERPYVVVEAGRIVVMCNDEALVPGMARVAVVEGPLPDAIPRWLHPPGARR